MLDHLGLVLIKHEVKLLLHRWLPLLEDVWLYLKSLLCVTLTERLSGFNEKPFAFQIALAKRAIETLTMIVVI